MDEELRIVITAAGAQAEAELRRVGAALSGVAREASGVGRSSLAGLSGAEAAAYGKRVQSALLATQLASLSTTERAMALSQGMNLSTASAKELQAALGQVGQVGIGGGMMAMGAMGAAVGIGAIAAGLVDVAHQYADINQSLLDMQQAYASVGKAVPTAAIEKFILKNAGLISDVNATREGFAKLTRAGIDQSLVTQAMTDAIELSQVKHIDLATAVELVTQALEGRGRGLIDLGIKMKDYSGLADGEVASTKKIEESHRKVTEAEAKLAEAMQKEHDLHDRLSGKRKLSILDQDHLKEAHQRVEKASADLAAKQGDLAAAEQTVNDKTGTQRHLLDDLGGKVKDAGKYTDDLTTANRKLGIAWDDLVQKHGSPLHSALVELNTELGDLLAALAGDAPLARPGSFAAMLFGPSTGPAGHWANTGPRGAPVWIPNSTSFSDAGVNNQTGGSGIGHHVAGGIVAGLMGQPQLILAHGGERVLTPEERQRWESGGSGGAGRSVTVVVNVQQVDSEDRVEQIRRVVGQRLAELVAR